MRSCCASPRGTARLRLEMRLEMRLELLPVLADVCPQFYGDAMQRERLPSDVGCCSATTIGAGEFLHGVGAPRVRVERGGSDGGRECDHDDAIGREASGGEPLTWGWC